MAQDVTEAKKRDRAITAMANELRQLIETANNPIFGTDINGIVNEWNPKTAELSGFTREEAFDEQFVSNFVLPSFRESAHKFLADALQENCSSKYEIEFRTKSNDSLYFLVNTTTRRDADNKIVGVLCRAIDMTEDRMHSQQLREIQSLHAADEAKVETERNITAYFAHELRNPLFAIDSALRSMPPNLPSDAQSLVDGMQMCITFMSQIMNNLLDLRKMEEGKMELTVAPFSLDSVLNNVTKMFLPTVRQDVQFISKCNTGKRDIVIGDSHRIQQVLNNVVSNAIKYTMVGSIVVELGWEDDNVRFTCTDMGPGIPIKEQKRLFERFVTRGGAPGTGLGLAIAKHLVDLMDGSIHFVSDPTVRPGTCCVVTFPLSPCEPSNDTILNQTNKEQQYSVLEGPLSFLIIDDVRINRSMLGRRIKRCIAPNAIITEAASGEDAMAICAKESFDIIVVDQYMEGAGGVMVGTDVVFAMRRIRINSVIIGCSGHDRSELFTQAGCDWVWGKPLPSNAVVVTQLRTALSNRNLLKEKN
eukprot:scaffold13134_cov52-Attheya_sp.AAC.1